MRVTYLAGTGDGFVSSLFFFGHAPSPQHRAFEGWIVRTSIALPFIARFRRGFQWFFYKGLLFQKHHLVRIFVGRWRHNFCEIAVRNFEKSKNRRKSLCAPLRIDSWRIWNNSTVVKLVYGRNCRCAPIYNISARRYIALTASVKFRIGSPKTARKEQVCAHQKSYRK